MPELPEVEAFKSVIQTHCLKKEIKDVKSSDKAIIKHDFKDFTKNLIGQKFTGVERLGKYLVITLDNKLKLIFHFALTGSLVFTKDLTQKIRFAKVYFIFSAGVLHFISIRKFEKIYLVRNINEIKGLSKIGPDALEISKQDFFKIAQKNSSKNIKAFLMDQDIISGIGNEYSDEILYQAGIDPHHKLSDLTDKDFEKIYDKMQKILKFAVKLQAKNVKNLSGDISFQSKQLMETFPNSYLQAHRHTDGLCPNDKNHKLVKVTIAGRSSYYCPDKQN